MVIRHCVSLIIFSILSVPLGGMQLHKGLSVVSMKQALRSLISCVRAFHAVQPQGKDCWGVPYDKVTFEQSDGTEIVAYRYMSDKLVRYSWRPLAWGATGIGLGSWGILEIAAPLHEAVPALMLVNLSIPLSLGALGFAEFRRQRKGLLDLAKRLTPVARLALFHNILTEEELQALSAENPSARYTQPMVMLKKSAPRAPEPACPPHAPQEVLEPL